MNHWERRVLYNEYMTSNYIEEPVVSRFTLALLEDTGWYQVNQNVAEDLVWGNGAGCDFLEQDCVQNSTAAFKEF